ncbi:MAG: SDR family NAD(P)-dependent oxidoreductase [Gemmatimonadaceae bacterium]
MPLALITGASAGIGRSYAESLARRGYDLMLVARSTARIEALGQDLAGRFHVKCDAWTADISSDAGCEAVAAKIAALPRLDLLINNAGFATTGKLARIDEQPQLEMLRLHVVAPMRLARAALPRMIERGSGAIINVSSIAGFLFGPGNVNYSATKAYLTSFSLGLDAELVGSGVRVQALCPGFTHTEIHDEMLHVKQQIPKWLWMQAADVVEISLRQLEDNGAVICIPGFKNKLMLAVLRRIPHALQRKMALRRRKRRGDKV